MSLATGRDSTFEHFNYSRSTSRWECPVVPPNEARQRRSRRFNVYILLDLSRVPRIKMRILNGIAPFTCENAHDATSHSTRHDRTQSQPNIEERSNTTGPQQGKKGGSHGHSARKTAHADDDTPVRAASIHQCRLDTHTTSSRHKHRHIKRHAHTRTQRPSSAHISTIISPTTPEPIDRRPGRPLKFVLCRGGCRKAAPSFCTLLPLSLSG